MMGVAERLPLAHSFRNMTSKRIRGIGKTILYGTFHGDMERRKGYITQNINEDAGFNDPEMALDTAHHETTHSIHFGLALAYQDGIIRADHPLHDDLMVRAIAIHFLSVMRPILYQRPRSWLRI